MSQWIESIALKDGLLLNLSYHQARVDKTLFDFASGYQIKLEVIFKSLDLPQSGCFKVRVIYDAWQVVDINWSAYTPHLWSEFRLVEADTLDYSYKYVDRSAFECLKRGFTESEIIIIKGGRITDTSYSNLIFHRGGEWFTPSTYLLAGTQRALLLDKKKIKEAEISLANLASFDSFKMINAMMSFDESTTYLIEQIKPL